MTYDPERHHRRSIRLKGYDYAQAGAYFVTICAHGRECLFGEVLGGEMRLNAYGDIVAQCWDDLPRHYPTVGLDAFVVMPNHVHGIVVLTDPATPAPANAGVVGAGLRPARVGAAGGGADGEVVGEATPAGRRPAPPLSEVVRAFKSFSARRVNELRGTGGASVWQRNYYEHIIRNERSLGMVRDYIAGNPARWNADQLHPANASPW
jgi:putative transposase